MTNIKAVAPLDLWERNKRFAELLQELEDIEKEPGTNKRGPRAWVLSKMYNIGWDESRQQYNVLYPKLVEALEGIAYTVEGEEFHRGYWRMHDTARQVLAEVKGEGK